MQMLSDSAVYEEKNLGISVYYERKYMNPVCTENVTFIGYFERFERNMQK